MDDGNPDDRSSALRGAGVAQVDTRRVVRALAAAGVIAVVVVAAALVVAGTRRNTEITDLRQHGVRVTVTMSGCLGLLGGSGSNQAGYSCSGTFSLGGHRYHEAIPGDVLYPPGTSVAAVAVPGDPGLVTTTRVLATEHPSAGVYVLPAVLLALLAAAVGGLGLVKVRRGGAGSGHGHRSTTLTEERFTRPSPDRPGPQDQPASRCSPSDLGGRRRAVGGV